MHRFPVAVLVAATVLFMPTAYNVQCKAQDGWTSIPSPGGWIKVAEGLHLEELSKGGLLIVQFREGPTDEQIRQLLLRGVVLGRYLGKGAYWARAGAGADLTGVRFLRAAVRPKPEDKIAPPLSRLLASSERDTLEITIVFSPEASEESVRPALRAAGAEILGDGMLYGNRLRAVIPSSKLLELADSVLILAVEPPPGPKRLLNATAARRTKVKQARSGFSLSGEGVAVGVWDEGPVDDHPDLAGRVTVVEKGKASEHSTHVAGTVAGSGAGRSKAVGMAPEAGIFSFNYNGDIATEMERASWKNGIALANNSWGYVNGWSYNFDYMEWEWYGDEDFGRYNSESAALDRLVTETGMVILFASGNDREDKGTRGEYYDVTRQDYFRTPLHPPDGPYDTVDVNCSAKNVIVVGATDKRDKMTKYSSWGPTADGRIKPDVVATGKGILSTVLKGNYARYSGTSMACPVVTGAAALLYELYGKAYGRAPNPAEVRALLAATADDRGFVGPDYSYGFGLLDAEAAAGVIDTSVELGTIAEGSVSVSGSGKSTTYILPVSEGTNLLKVAVAWLDPPAAPNAAEALVNDLDIALISPSGIRHPPWKLDGANPQNAAVRGVNEVDNIELAEVANPEAGNWTIEVTASRIGSGGSQEFALVVFADQPPSGKLLRN
jgi:subtilisin family serine protease